MLNVMVLLFCLFVCFSIIFALLLTAGTSKYVATTCMMMKTLARKTTFLQWVSRDKNISSNTALFLPLMNLKLSLEV